MPRSASEGGAMFYKIFKIELEFDSHISVLGTLDWEIRICKKFYLKMSHSARGQWSTQFSKVSWNFVIGVNI